MINSYRSTINVILKDVNDNAPVLPSPSEWQLKISENTFTSEPVDLEPIFATDKDEGLNAQVSFRIVSIKPSPDNGEVPTIEEAFDIKSDPLQNRGTLVVVKTLQGFHGTWAVEIEAYDHGDEGDSGVSLSSTETYMLEIEPFNFNAPKIIFPNKDQTLRLRYPQSTNVPLYTFDNRILDSFEAVDVDGGVFGQVEFRIVGSVNDKDHESFQFIGDGTNKYQLQISQSIDDRIYEIHIQAVDGGGLMDEITNLRLAFVNPDGNPVFQDNQFETVIVENDAAARVSLPAAVDPKNEGVTDPSELYAIYYFLSAPSDLFVIDLNTGELSLKQALEWTAETEEYEIVVVATNYASGPSSPDDNSKLTVKIIVEDVNDKPPKFELQRYGAGITTDDPVDKIILKVKAIDPDKDDKVTYHILPETMESSPSLNSVKDAAFEVIGDTDPGEVQLKIKVLDTYSGYFTFTIQARDLVDHTDEATVRVYIIAESNRVSFIFRNTREEVEEQRTYVSRYKLCNSQYIQMLFAIQQIADTLAKFFEYDCFVDDVQPYDDGRDTLNIEVRAHFVDNEGIVVDGEMIRA